jgi:outer membrane protein OmpA-like peptidoglycan-associated protein|tara:strand:+ start:182 stop:964 length:783 start_codon:yes stop_codon:yes gene_type:complete
VTAFAGQDDSPPEHPVIKPMTGATPTAESSVDDFGRLVVGYRGASGAAQEVAEGRYWHLFYQLEDRETSRDEILSNYAAAAERIGGEIQSRTATRLRFRIVQRGGGVIWCRLDARAGDVYELEIVDEAGLDLSVEFDADALLAALTKDGRVALYGILFDVDRATLQPGSGEVLDTIASIMSAQPGLRLEVQGHTDSTGTAERNRTLSQERAAAVVSVLQLYGVDASRLEARGFGPDQPIGDNSTENGRQRNRRVELVRLP